MLNLILKDQTLHVNKWTSVQHLSEIHQVENVVGCILNGKVHDLNYQLKQSGTFQWILKDSAIGKLMQERTLIFLLITAVRHLFNTDVHVRHTLASGLYVTLNDRDVVSVDDIQLIKKKMDEMIHDDLSIERHVVLKEEAVAHFEALNRLDLAKLLSQRTSTTSSIYTCNQVDDYFYGVMYTHAGMINEFTLLPYQKGLWISFMKEQVDQPKLFQVFERFEQRGQQVGITNIAELNEAVQQGRLKELIEINEQRVNDDLDAIVSRIHQNKSCKMVLIAGPSSAGKTTTSLRIAEKLTNLGHHPVTLAMDDFFKDRVDSPRFPDGSYDYENIECIDLALFNNTLKSLLNNEAVKIPVYDFTLGEKIWPNPPVTLKDEDILIIEGIHALNPRSSELIGDEQKVRIYINALTHLNYDDHNRIPTSDYRLIRRMMRDVQFRGRSISTTIEGWQKVKDGEDMYIYPYQEEADVILNTSMDYELAVLKSKLMPLLDAVDVNDPQYIEVNRIRKLLAYVIAGDPELVPAYSILKEFLGGSLYTE